MSVDPLGFQDLAARRATALAIYQALRNSGQMSKHRRLAYWCTNPNRCSLVDVFDVPDGTVVAQPRYKTSPTTTAATSSESGRRTNSEDGDRHWKARAALLDDTDGLELSCDHLHMVRLSGEDLRADIAAGHTEVRVRKDGTTYVVR